MPSVLNRQRAFSITAENFGPARVVLAVKGELDLATAPQFREHVERELDSGAERIVVDLSAVTFIDSVALGVLAGARRRLGERGRLALVVGPDSYATLILKASGLCTVLECFDSYEAATAALYA